MPAHASATLPAFSLATRLFARWRRDVTRMARGQCQAHPGAEPAKELAAITAALRRTVERIQLCWRRDIIFRCHREMRLVCDSMLLSIQCC